MTNAFISNRDDARRACLAALVLAAEKGFTQMCVLPDMASAIPATARESLDTLLSWIAQDAEMAAAVEMIRGHLARLRATKH